MTKPLKADDTEIKWDQVPPLPPGSTVGDRVERSLATAVRTFFGLFDEPLAELGAWVLRLFMKILEKSVGQYVDPLLRKYVESAAPGDPVAEMLEAGLKPKGVAWAAIGAGLGIGAGQAGLLSFLEPFFERARQIAYKGFPTKVFDPPTALGAFWRGELSQDELNDVLERFGFTFGLHDKLVQTVRPRVPEDELARWYLRDTGREGPFRTELMARGYDSGEVDKILELLEVIPAPVDQIRMAVREAFDPAIVSAYQLDADLHKVPFESLAKVGLTEEWARYFWYAHWVLPSVMQGYEMLHRGEINKEELETLMRSLDIMPGWIPKLIAISYRPYTRVDVRRMHATGVLDEAAVLQSYKDIGYDPEKAQKMTEFTLRYNVEDEREATKTDILSAMFEKVISRELAGELLGDIGYGDLYVETYLAATDYRMEQRARKDEDDDTKEELTKERELTKGDILGYYLDGGISESEARGFLAEIDYPGTVIDLLIAKTDFRRLQNIINEVVKTTRILYINEEIDLVGVHERLGRYALPAAQVEELLLLWGIERDRRTERPTKGELLSWYLNGVIEETFLREQMAKHKYGPDYIDLYVVNSDRIILEKATAELEREQKEQERLAKAEFKTDRMLTMADLNVQIAEWRVLIAELKTIMVNIVPPGTKDQMRTQIRVKEQEVASLQVTIAARKEMIAEAIELAPTLEIPEDIESLKARILRLKTEIAGVELEIAELREEIASIRTELSRVVEPDERLAYIEQIALATQAITELQLQKAQVPVVYIPIEV